MEKEDTIRTFEIINYASYHFMLQKKYIKTFKPCKRLNVSLMLYNYSKKVKYITNVV